MFILILWRLALCVLFTTICVVAIRQLKLTSPRLIRIACLGALLVGWLPVAFTFHIPFYSATLPDLSLNSTNTLGGEEYERPEQDGKTTSLRFAGNSSKSVASSWFTDLGSRGFLVQATTWLTVGIWFIGTGLAIGLFAWRYTKCCVAVNRRIEPSPSQQQQWRELLQEARAPAIPFWLTSQLGPMLCFLPWGHAVVAPARHWRQLPADYRKAILRHELAHYQRGDIWKTWIMLLLALPQWFNPAAWWAVQTFVECGEWLADSAAAKTPQQRIAFAQALTRFAEESQPHLLVAGHAAYGRPLVTRIQRLFATQPSGDTTMKKVLFLTLAVAVCSLQLVRFNLVAKEAETSTVDSVKQKVASFDESLLQIKQSIDDMQANGAQFKATQKERVAKIKSLAGDPSKLSEPMQRRAELLQSGEEAKQIEALQKIETFGDEGVLALGYAAKDSAHTKVRKVAIEKAAALKEAGFAAIAIAYDSFNEEERIYAIEQLSKHETPNHIFIYAFVGKNATGDLLEAVIQAGVKLEKRTLFIALTADKVISIDRAISLASEFEGDDGLLLLYAAAKKGQPENVLKAVKHAAKRGSAAYPVLAIAMKTQDAVVRKSVVQAARKIGGEAGDFLIERAISDSNAELRDAAKSVK